ncbi:MAG: TIGR03009 domain-containing protein [Pirellulales bacterium]|nr:TIGR03009 domain-containing protein [Pirellulales bacterium]
MPTARRIPTALRLSAAFAVATTLPASAQQLGQPTYGPGYQQQSGQTAPTPGAPGGYSGQQPGPGAPIGPTTPGHNPAAALAPQPPAPPFQLSEVEFQFVQQVLQMWETKSSEIKTYNAKFERLEYDAVFGPGPNAPMLVSTGQLSYSRPDKGSFKIDEIKRWKPKNPQVAGPDAPGDWQVQKEEIGEHWVCDGKAVYEYNHPNKQLRVTPIPEQMRGEEIANGPLPFLFSAKANQMLQRYWIRAQQSSATQILLEAYPRRQSDAANYQRCDIMLDRKTMQPVALQVHLPGGQQRHVYTFQTPTINGTFEGLFGGLFSAPRTPLGWTKVVHDDGAPPTGDNPAQAAASGETQRQ